MSDKKIKGVAVRDFDDFGTGRHFEKGKTYEFTEGEHRNFSHASLIRAPESGDPKPEGDAAPATTPQAGATKA